MEAVKFAEGSETEIVGLLAPNGGPFNGADVVGERFSVQTDFVLDWFTDRPLLYHHGLDSKTGASVIGRIKSLSSDDKGLWMQAQLDANHEYYSAIKELIEKGKLALSSGSMRHLVEVNKKSGEILRWPLIEGSLTPTPANPFAEVAFAEAKSHFKAIGIDLPDDEDTLKAELTSKRRNALSDDDFAYIDSEGGRHLPIHDKTHVQNALARFEQTEFESEEAKRKAKKKLLAAAEAMGIEATDDSKKSVKAVSWEDIRRDINTMIEQQLAAAMPWGDQPGYCYVEEMYSDHAIVCICKNGQERYYSVPFTLGEDGHVAGLGQPTQVEETYVPVTGHNMDTMPIGIHAEMAKTYTASLLERTKDLRERRVKEGRVLSTATRKRLNQCLDAMRGACDEMAGLLDSTEPAKAGNARLRLEMLKLYAATLPS